MNELEMCNKVGLISRLAFELSNKLFDDDSENGLPVAMVHMAGHVGMISIDLHENGWTSGCSATKRYEVYYNGEHTRYQAPESFDEIIDELNRLCEKRYKLTMEAE